MVGKEEEERGVIVCEGSSEGLPRVHARGLAQSYMELRAIIKDLCWLHCTTRGAAVRLRRDFILRRALSVGHLKCCDFSVDYYVPVLHL